MDRRLPGIIAIALLFSTMLSYFIFGDSPENSITVIRNTAPDRIRRQVDLELTHNFVLGLVVREPVDELIIRYSFYVPSEPLRPPPDTSLRGWEEHLDKYSVQWELLRSVGFEPLMLEGELERDEEEARYLLFDFGAALPALVHAGLAEDATTSNLVIPSPQGNATHMTGKSGFYHNPTQISRVIVSRNDREEVFTAQRSAQELKPGEKPIGEAPRNGEMVFQDLEADDTISVILEVMGRADQSRGSLSLIQLYVDGHLEEVLLNPIA